MKYIRVTADTNDADYVDIFQPVSEEDLRKMAPVIEAIKGFKPYRGKDKTWKCKFDNNWPTGECLRDDLGEKELHEIYPQLDPELIEWFNDEFVPWGEYGIHTIESIETMDIENLEDLLA